MEYQNITSSVEKDIELIEVLSAISQVSGFRELEKMLKTDGWFEVSQEGSHHQYKHPIKKGKVTIPEHGGDLKKSTVKSIMRQAGL